MSDGLVTQIADGCEYVPAVWTFVHRGYSGGGMINVWVYPDRDLAVRAAGRRVVDIMGGLHGDERPGQLWRSERYDDLIALYNSEHEGTPCVMGVQPGWVQE